MTDFKFGISDAMEVRDVVIEDLLGRPQTPLDRESMKNLVEGKRVLITGAGGSIGSEIARQISDLKPASITLVENSEFNLYSINMEISNRHPDLYCQPLIGDIRDSVRINSVFNEVKPDLVFHAAALKQVPAAEYNPMECIKTNIYGAENVINAAIANNVEKVIALSTDKAANPINLYGATKLASDKLFVSANNIVGDKKTRFSVVRYGNVVGSRGSVVPLFQNLIRENTKKLPITDIRMTRFWITLQQGVDFVMDCFNHMQGGEVFVPKLPSVLITDLAKAMSSEIDFEIIGIRPGEKIHEVMCPADDSHLTIEFEKYFLIKPSIKFTDSEINYEKNKKDNSIGKLVSEGFAYNSGDNEHFLSVEEIRKINLSEIV